MPSSAKTPGGAPATPAPPPVRALLFLMAGALLISFSAVMVRLAGVGPATSAFYRVLLGGVVLLAWACLRGQRLWAGGGTLAATALAALLFALDLGLWHRSIVFLGPGLSTILSNFQVFGMALVGMLFFHERPGWRLAVAIPLALLGLWGLVGASWPGMGPGPRLGVVLGLLTACAYTGYLLSVRWTVRRAGGLRPEANMAWVSLIAAFFLLLEVWRAGESLAVPTAADWGWLTLYGLGPHALGWVFISLGLLRVEASRAGLVLLLQPTMAFVWDLVIFHRPTTWLEAGGAILAVGAIYLGSSRRAGRAA